MDEAKGNRWIARKANDVCDCLGYQGMEEREGSFKCAYAVNHDALVAVYQKRCKWWQMEFERQSAHIRRL